MRQLYSLMILAAMTVAPTLSAQVTSLFPKHTRSHIYNYTPVELPDSLIQDPDSRLNLSDGIAPVMNMLFFEEVINPEEKAYNDSIRHDSIMRHIRETPIVIEYTDYNPYPLAETYLRPAVFDKVHLMSEFEIDPHTVVAENIDPLSTEWLSRAVAQADLMRHVRQRYIVDRPYEIKYDERHLPEPPKEFTAVVDPETARILIREVIPVKEMPKTELKAEFDKKHWLKTFNANLQFSQAFVSPNWYQGGNNNLNALLSLYYDVKLNPAFHENLLFDNTFQYKLGITNAPDDELRNYSISQDLFQWNMTFGIKSIKRWYYSVNAQLKTQLLNNYKSNTTTLKAAFLSPGELNVGVGMTYNYANAKKTFTFDASISPFSYNMKTCVNKHMNVTSFGIEEGRKTVSEYGSSAEGKLFWQLCENISLRSRLFVFTDYDYIQSDFENTFMFTINKYLTTQVFVHMRYDSTSPVVEDTSWHKFQLKEILSFGFTYKFGS